MSAASHIQRPRLARLLAVLAVLAAAVVATAAVAPGARAAGRTPHLFGAAAATWRHAHPAAAHPAAARTTAAVRAAAERAETPDVTPSGVPSAPGPLVWSDPLPVDLAPITGISCPASTLCVAVDRLGGAVWSTDPTGGARQWHGADVDLGNSLTSISCPSTAECVAVDDAGNVVTTTDPTGGAAAWSVAQIDANVTTPNTDNAGPFLLRGVSCPSTTECVAVDADGDAFASTDPTGGAGAWAGYFADPGRTRGCGAAGATCQPPILGVSCPSTALCVGVDIAGDILTTQTPTVGNPWTVTAAPASVRSLWGISCPTTGFCAAASGPGRSVLTFSPLAPTAIAVHTVPHAVYGLQCPSESLCLGAAESQATNTSGVLGTTAPTAKNPQWAFGPPGLVNATACPAAPVCLAVDGEGNVSAGVSVSGVSDVLRGDLLRVHETRGELAASGSETVRVPSAIPASVQLVWQAGGSHAAATFADLQTTFSAPGVQTLHLRLTAAGLRALRGRSALTIDETAVYATGTGSVTRTREIHFAGTKPPAKKKPAKTHRHHPKG